MVLLEDTLLVLEAPLPTLVDSTLGWGAIGLLLPLAVALVPAEPMLVDMGAPLFQPLGLLLAGM